MKTLFKEIKEWKQGYKKYLVYSYKFTVWLYLNRWRSFCLFIKKHGGIVKRVLLVAFAVAVGMFANHFGFSNTFKDSLGNYLIAVGAMIGGTIAIIYSISIFLLQGVADLYSSKHFVDYTNSWTDKMIYAIVIVITILFFGAGLLVDGLQTITNAQNSQIVLGSLGLIGLVFSLIDWQYELMRKKLSPVNAIMFLEKKGFGFLKELQYNAGKIAEIIVLQNQNTSNEIALATAYNHVLKPFINDLDRQLETLVEISMKLADRQEIETTKRGFTAMHNLLIMFLEARKTSSLVIPSQNVFFATEGDSQSFFANNFERLNKSGEKFMNEGKEEIAVHIVDIYNSLAIKAKEVSFVGQRNENPIISNIVGYLNFFIEIGERTKNIEVVYRGVNTLGRIAFISTEKGLDTILFGIQGNLLNVAIFGLTEKNTVIVDGCISNYLGIIES